jgi:uncharacterized membrane protein YhaH (DUF805 family)
MKKITVGRDSGCDVVVSDPDHVISRLHAEITLSGATCFFRDMSTNGTVVNGRRVHNEEISIEYGTPVMLAGKIPLVWQRVDELVASPALKQQIPSSTFSVKDAPNSSVQSFDFKGILFSFNGRISRSTCWTYTLSLCVIQFIVYGFFLMIARISSSNLFSFGVASFLLSLILLLFVWPGLALSVKRCHDRNKSGWFHLVSFVPFLGIWYIVEIYFLKGSDGSNQYGEEPEYNPELKQYTVIAAVLYIFSYLYFMWQSVEYLQNIFEGSL